MHARTYRRWHAHSLTHKHAYERALARARTHTHARTLPHAQTRSHARARAQVRLCCCSLRLRLRAFGPALSGTAPDSGGHRCAAALQWQGSDSVRVATALRGVGYRCAWLLMAPGSLRANSARGCEYHRRGTRTHSFVELYDTRLVHTEPAAGTGKQECKRRLEPVEIDLKAPADSEQPRGPLPVARRALRLPGGA